MNSGFLLRFLGALDSKPSHIEGLVAACRELEAEPSSEFARILRSSDLDLSMQLDRLDAAEWRILEDRDRSFGQATIHRSLEFVDELYPRELSSQLAAQVFLRTSRTAIPEVRQALHGRAYLVAPLRIREIALAGRRLTCAIPRSARLTRADVSAAPTSHTMRSALGNFRFGREILSFLRHWSELDDSARPSEWVTSADLLRAGLGRGAEQRLSDWLLGAGISMVELVRAQPEEPRAGEVHGFPFSEQASEVLDYLLWSSSLANQAPTVDRLMISSLLVSESWLAGVLRSITGPAINLPLLFIRSGNPQGLTTEEVFAVVRLGDEGHVLGSSPVAGDLSPECANRLLLESVLKPAFDDRARLLNFFRDEENVTIAPAMTTDPFLTGDAVDLFQLLSRRSFRSGESPALTHESLRLAWNDRPRQTGAGRWAYQQYQSLVMGPLTSRQDAAIAMGACQRTSLGRQLIGRISHRSSDVEELHTAGDALLCFKSARIAHSLASGVLPHRYFRHPSDVALSICGGPDEFLIAAGTKDWSATESFTLSSPAAVRLWSAIRDAVIRDDSQTRRSALLELAEAIRLPSFAPRLRNADVEFTAVAPFDNFLVDIALREVCHPRSITQRVFGGGPGHWQGSYPRLAMAGGQRIVIGDPSSTLHGAAHEAAALSSVLQAELIAGPLILRAHVVRALEASTERPQLLHFTGHGVSGLVTADGEIASGVIAADGEVVTLGAIREASMPRVLVTSACDVGTTPPIAGATGWMTTAVSAGAAYVVAPSVPVTDRGSLVFMLILYDKWSHGLHLEDAMQKTIDLGSMPKDLLQQWHSVAPPKVRDVGTAWIRGSAAADVQFGMGCFLLSTF